MDLLLNQEPVNAVHQLRNIRRLYDSVETHARTRLEESGCQLQDLWYSVNKPQFSTEQGSIGAKADCELEVW